MCVQLRLFDLTTSFLPQEAIDISKGLEIPVDACFDDLLKIPIFQTSLASSKTMMVNTGSLTYILMYVTVLHNATINQKDLRDWLIGSYDSLGASLFMNDAKVVVCLKVVTCGAPTYIIFDLSPRENGSSGPSLKRADGIDQVETILRAVLATSFPSHGVENAGPVFFAYLLSRNTEEADRGRMEAENDAPLSKETLSADNLLRLPAVPEKPFVLHGPTHGPIISSLGGGPDARTSALSSSGGSVVTDTSSDTMSKSRWQDYVWPLSLQTTSSASPESSTDDSEKHSTDLRRPKSYVPVHRKDETTPPIASTSRRIESSDNATLDFCHRRYIQDLRRSLVSSGKRASQNSEKAYHWETALLQQLQDEEEIASALPPQTSSEYTWLVALQKKLQAENHPSTSISSSELDWQLAVQLQQEVYQEENLENGTPRIVVESENNDRESASRPSSSTTQIGRLRVPEHRNYGDSFESLNLYDHTPPYAEASFQCGVCGDMHRSVDTIVLEICSHRFCKECLGGFVRTKIEDRKYPIFCPECIAERMRTAKTRTSCLSLFNDIEP